MRPVVMVMAVRELRHNLTWRGVYRYLRARHAQWDNRRGWAVLLTRADWVLDDADAMSSGAFV